MDNAVSENWREERDRLVELLKSVVDGETTPFHGAGRRNAQAIHPRKVSDIKARVAALNFRLGEPDA